MIKVLLATGFTKLDDQLIKRFPNESEFKFVDKPVYFREGVSEKIERFTPDIIVISDFLEGASITITGLVKLIRKKFPNLRIIYLTKTEENVDMKKFLFSMGIYDVLSIQPRINSNELKDLIIEGLQWKDVSHFFTDFDPSERFQIDEELMSNSNSENQYKSFRTKQKKNIDNIKGNIITFWSPRHQSGNSTMIANASLLLTSRPEEKILLIDFNLQNPNLHLLLNTEDHDGDHNLSALCEDLTLGEVKTSKDISKYIITHKTFSNISFLPGFILKYELPKEDVLMKSIDFIIKYSIENNYTAVMFDMDSDLSFQPNLHLMKKSSKIILPLSERPGTIVNLQKVFDAEFGPFFLNFLDINKVYPVLNFSTDTNETIKITQLIQNLLKREIYAEIPYLREIVTSNNEGVPYLREKPNVDILREFIKLTNCIHDVFIVPPKLNSKKKSFFNKK
jgi:MinD-like ATPase involved in chromosome partitioning or flagellar assembly